MCAPTLALRLLVAGALLRGLSGLDGSARAVKGLQEGMRMRTLPHSDLLVSELALGTMMFGDQVSQSDAFAQLSAATKDYGINFIDTAESYPVPSAPSSSGASEKILGRWLAANKGMRAQVVISSSVCGFSDQITWLRKGGAGTRVTRAQLFEAVDGILARLGTDYLDVLQLHWPERYVPLFGAPEYLPSLERPDAEPIVEQLRALADLVKAGKIRAFGLGNETPHGVASFSMAASLLGLPRPSLAQNTYNLLVRNEVEGGLAEACSKVNCDLALVACSPLAGGALSGKYLDPKHVDPSARMRRYVGYMDRFICAPAREATRLYRAVADDISMPLAPLALAWVYSRPHVASTVIGVTSLSQLEDAVMALNIPLSEEVLRMLNGVHRQHLDPTKGSFEIVDPYMEYTDPSKLPWGGRDQDVDPELDILINQRLTKF